MKRVLIISPYFPPINAADMQRVRMSLPYYKEFGWEAEIVTVDLKYSDMVTDLLLVQSVPRDTRIHYVRALPKKWTSKFGLGNIALRSLLHYRRYVNQLLKQKHFDLIYFSTTQFAVTVLGPYWKRKFGVPYVIDMQDPWHSIFYLDKPKSQRPPKYWFAYQLSKRLEPVAMKQVGGLIAVSESYLTTLAGRYPHCENIPKRTITFGAFEKDFAVASQNTKAQPSALPAKNKMLSVVYVGRGGQDMQRAISYLLQAFKKGLDENRAGYRQLHFYFIGTSYAPAGKGLPTVLPIAVKFGVGDHVTEITDRIPFYQTLNTLSDAAALFIPGSTDPQYTASKIYPYVLAKKPLLAIFHPKSSVVPFLHNCGVGTVITFNQEAKIIEKAISEFLNDLIQEKIVVHAPAPDVLNEFSARVMTQKQCELFNAVRS